MVNAADEWSTDRLSSGDRRRFLTAGLLVLLGFGIVAHPLYLWPHYGQTGYAVDVKRTSEVPESSVKYGALPPGARAAFDEAIAGEESVLWSGEDGRAVEFYWDRPAVHYDGNYYRVTLLHGDSGDFIQPLLRWFLTAAGTFLVVFGGSVLYAASCTPLTPMRALWMPAALSVAFAGTNAYDVLFSGVRRAVLNFPSRIVLLVPVTTIALAVGSAVAAGRDSRTVVGGVVGMALLGVAVANTLHPISLLVLAGYLAIGGAPWFAIGYELTTDIPDR